MTGLRFLPAIFGQQVGDDSPVPTSGLVRWVDASDAATITASGSTVTEWADRSGEGWDFDSTANGGPTTGVRTVNSLNAVDFDGDDIAGNNLLSSASDIGATVFVVCQADDSHIGSIYNEAHSSNQADQWRILTSAGPARFIMRQGAGAAQIDITGSTSLIGAAHLVAVVQDAPGSGASLRVDGSQEASVASYTDPGVLNLTTAALGYLVRGGSDIQPFDGGICELLVYQRTLSGAEIGQVEAYLAAKWGVSI